MAALAVLLTGCANSVSLSSDELACSNGDEGGPANGVVLMAQAVPTASHVPCLNAVPLGWHLSDVQVRDGSGRFYLDSDRAGIRAIEVRLSASCDTRDATEIPSDRPDARRFEQVSQVSPAYVGTRHYVFEGGCLTMLFRLGGDDRAEPLGVASQGIDVVPRADVEAHVRDKSGGRLQLDAAARGAP
jgi:hypothetical protein